MENNKELRDNSSSERKIVDFKTLPSWLQELWDIDTTLARKAENHYLELIEKKEIEGVDKTTLSNEFTRLQEGYRNESDPDGKISFGIGLYKAVDVINEHLLKKEKLVPSFWFMRDNHTFCQPEGDTMEDIKKSFVAIAKENPYGMVAQVALISLNKEIRIGKNFHVNGKGEVDIEGWYESFKDHKLFKYGK